MNFTCGMCGSVGESSHCKKCGCFAYKDSHFLKEQVKTSTQVIAVKHDEGKPDMTLVTYAMLEDATKVLMFGEKKYARFNYRNPSPDFEKRMLAAVVRHVTKHNGGEDIDNESGLPHLAHALATLMMIFDRRVNGRDE